MKIKTSYLILSLMVVILLVVPGMLFAIEPVMVKQSITMKGVYFSKTPQSVQVTLPPALKNIPRSPAPLTPQVRNNAINQIRGAIGLKALIPVVPAGTVVPTRVVLTPYAPKSGLSNYTIYNGHNFPDPRGGGSGSGMPFSYVLPISGSHLQFTFDTLPGKTYMADLAVGPDRTFTLLGAFGGEVNLQGSHIIIGFTANSKSSLLIVKAKEVSSASGLSVPDFVFWRCELTQVN